MRLYVFTYARMSQAGLYEDAILSQPQTAIFRTMEEAKDEIRRLKSDLERDGKEWCGYSTYESGTRYEFFMYGKDFLDEIRITIQEYGFAEG